MKVKIKVEVTAADIKKGCRGDAGNCPIARALYRVTHLPWRVTSYKKAYVSKEDGGTLMQIDMPEKADHFIRRFDTKQKVKPLTFVVRELQTF